MYSILPKQLYLYFMYMYITTKRTIADLVRERRSSWVERIRQRIVQNITHGRHVDISESAETVDKIWRIVVGTKNAAKLRIEQFLGGLPVGKEK